MSRIEALPELLGRLVQSEPPSLEEIGMSNKAGVYTFSEYGALKYVGRTRNLRSRHKNHCHEISRENSAAFAFRLARIPTGNLKPTYQKTGSRKDLMSSPTFIDAFKTVKVRIRQMEIRFIEIDDSVTQTLFEIYTSLALKSEHMTSAPLRKLVLSIVKL